ncbi:MAG: phospho-N-acetylmuramoyl-pentapeptide-transferase [Lachnospiraceae bacterium]|uniref:Phospho-N-acetylmuramoyl-pentapeptide-transferase n=1 Tax=Candidatus Weimeria bifida TaxID=2599074 RepID=A0A6N7IWV6_9FIRM|nr:phospho-N-acetylmuramoyl-pentapeptide-transferase [Candidatus Weimeria bifida]RRF96251.1 MAG: phospho-N-acetylmuramoyl-pentapeptide-transferase [Lachnospiraceae bacterium]
MLQIVVPLIAAFAVSVLLGPVVIPWLKKLHASQTERDYLKTHVAKNGTPTMGGIMILAGLLVGTLIGAAKYPKVLPILVLAIGFGIIGFLDDFLKVALHRTDGLFPWQKMLLQIIVTTIFAVWLIKFTDVDLAIMIPFTSQNLVNIPEWLAIVILYFAVLGTVNGTNFTDGLDGLASSVTIVVAVFFMIASLLLDGDIEPVCAAMAGALCGFLVYNHYPAKVFMGDTGSLALGGFVAGAAYLLHMPIFILIAGFIYLIEVVSVILQVGVFKLTHGKKRLFKMAPIHHHFEKSGYSEKQIVIAFTLVTVGCCAVALLGLIL